MRLIHTADWHLGRIFHGVHLTENQAHALDKLVEIVRDARPHAVIVAGDVYDRAVPPQDAVSLLDDVLYRLVSHVGATVVLIAGNHDSPERLNFGAKLLEKSRLFVYGVFSPDCRPVVLRDEHGPVHIYPLPFAEPAVVRERTGRTELDSHEKAMAEVLRRVRERHPAGARSVLVAHAAVLGGKASDSERPLSIGGADTVPPGIFDGFHYVALGHLHRPQHTGDEHIRYAGSLLKYSFSEAGQEKSVTLVDMDADGKCAIEEIPISPRRNVRCIRGTLEEILNGARSDPDKDDYIMATLLDREPVFNAMGRLREVYPNTLHVERAHFKASSGELSAPGDHKKIS